MSYLYKRGVPRRLSYWFRAVGLCTRAYYSHTALQEICIISCWHREHGGTFYYHIIIILLFHVHLYYKTYTAAAAATTLNRSVYYHFNAQGYTACGFVFGFFFEFYELWAHNYLGTRCTLVHIFIIYARRIFELLRVRVIARDIYKQYQRACLSRFVCSFTIILNFYFFPLLYCSKYILVIVYVPSAHTWWRTGLAPKPNVISAIFVPWNSKDPVCTDHMIHNEYTRPSGNISVYTGNSVKYTAMKHSPVYIVVLLATSTCIGTQ